MKMHFVCVSFAVLLSGAFAGPVTLYKTYDEFPFYNRSEWDAAPATDIESLITPVPYVVIHHTYIPGACYSKEACITSMKSMQNYHISLDWGDIGYNFCVGTDGAAYEGRGWQTVGIHTGIANHYSLGICLIGDFRETLPPPEVLSTTKALINAGLEQGYVDPNYKLIAHKQVMATECPGNALFEEISKWKHFSKDGFVPVIRNKTNAKPV